MKRLDQWLGSKRAGRSRTPTDGQPYPFHLRRRRPQKPDVPAGGGLEVFDSSAAKAINEARMRNLQSLELPLRGKRVLDVGCGVGHLADCIAKMGAGVVGVDAREQNIQALRQRYPQFEAHVANAESDPLTRLGKFDVVFSYGLLYHLENPLLALRNMESVCGELLLLETIICDHELPLARAEDEFFAANEALGALACRPSPSYVALALSRIGFAQVYTPRVPPDHEDFRFQWLNNLDCARDGHPLRCVFVASRTRLQNPRLVALLND